MIGTCKLCGKELKNKRACHGHLITSHGAEYRAAGMNQAKFINYVDDIDAIDSARKSNNIASNIPNGTPGGQIRSLPDRPRGLRHLNMKNPREAAAAYEVDDEYNERFEYIDDDANVYCQGELIKRGWL